MIERMRKRKEKLSEFRGKKKVCFSAHGERKWTTWVGVRE